MIAVVADTSPLSYLIQIEQQNLLARLYGRILIPAAVHAELHRETAPVNVRNWAANPPEWLTIKLVPPLDNVFLSDLDEGEREAIALAEASGADLLLIDERRGTKVARSRGLETLGTLGILILAHKRGWVDAIRQFERLAESTTFRHTADLKEELFLALKK